MLPAEHWLDGFATRALALVPDDDRIERFPALIACYSGQHARDDELFECASVKATLPSALLARLTATTALSKGEAKRLEVDFLSVFQPLFKICGHVEGRPSFIIATPKRKATAVDDSTANNVNGGCDGAGAALDRDPAAVRANGGGAVTVSNSRKRKASRLATAARSGTDDLATSATPGLIAAARAFDESMDL